MKFATLKAKLAKQATVHGNVTLNPKKSALPDSIWRDPAQFVASGFGSGALPIAPGTWGSVVGVVVFFALAPLSLWLYLCAVVLITGLSIWVSQLASDTVGVHDHSGLNVDEIVGMLVTMIAVPATWTWVCAGFILFRIFDILKPWPINYLDAKVDGGFGMIIDDVAAGLFACVCLQVINYFLV